MKRFLFFVFVTVLIFASIYWYILNYSQATISKFEIKDTREVLYINYKNQELIRLAPYNVLGKFKKQGTDAYDYKHIFKDLTLQKTKKSINFSPLCLKETTLYGNSFIKTIYKITTLTNKAVIQWNSYGLDNLKNHDSMQEIWLAVQFVNIKEPKLSDGMFTFIHQSSNCKGVVGFEKKGCRVDFKDEWNILFFKCAFQNNVNISFTLQCF